MHLTHLHDDFYLIKEEVYETNEIKVIWLNNVK
jgi:hypothetical protein